MQFYLKPEGGPKLLFSVLDGSGQPVYEVRGEFLSFGNRFTLRTPEGGTTARLTGVSLPGVFRYTAVSGVQRVRIWVRPEAAHKAVQFKGKDWHFRGSLLTRSFDIVEERRGFSPSVMMTHGHCWSGRTDCYAVTVTQAADVPLALCVAVAVDFAVPSGCASPVPAG